MPENALELRLLSADEMNKVKQPDDVVWPTDSFAICAFDENGTLKGRVGMIALPHMEGMWVAHEYLTTRLAEAMVAKLEENVRKLKRTSILTFIFNDAHGLAKELEKHHWDDLGMKVYQKEL